MAFVAFRHGQVIFAGVFGARPRSASIAEQSDFTCPPCGWNMRNHGRQGLRRLVFRTGRPQLEPERPAKSDPLAAQFLVARG